MTQEVDSLEFEVNYLFEERKGVFSSIDNIRSFYEILYDFDKTLLHRISIQLNPHYSLVDIDYGSIRSRVVQFIRGNEGSIEQTVRGDDILGKFLLKAKLWLLQFLENKTRIDSKNDIELLANQINKGIQELGTSNQQLLSLPDLYYFINLLAGIQKVTDQLSVADSFEYKTTYGSAIIRKGIFINGPKILAELGQNVITNDTIETLKAKRIELLNSRPTWEFIRGKKTIHAIMSDQKWLDDFHARKISIQTNDSLKVKLRTIYTYTNSYTKAVAKFEVLEVLDIVNPNINALTLF